MSDLVAGAAAQREKADTDDGIWVMRRLRRVRRRVDLRRSSVADLVVDVDEGMRHERSMGGIYYESRGLRTVNPDTGMY